MRLFQHWFNHPPSRDTPFITDKYGEKFWIQWEENEQFAFLDVLYRGRFVGRVNLDFSKPGEAIIADIRIFRIHRRDDKLRKRGLGKAMLQEAISKARERGAGLVWGWIVPDEFTSVEYLVEWYRRQGFDVHGKDGKYTIKKRLE